MPAFIPVLVGAAVVYGALKLGEHVYRRVNNTDVVARIEFREEKAVCTLGKIEPRILSDLQDFRKSGGAEWTSIEKLRIGAVKVYGTVTDQQIQRVRNILFT